MRKKTVCFNYCDIDLTFKKDNIITILGNSNNFIMHYFIKNKYSVISYDNVVNLKKNITVYEEISKYIKTNKKVDEYINLFELYDVKDTYIKNISISEKIKLIILIHLVTEENIIIYNLLSLLDYCDYKTIIKILKSSNIPVINITNNIEESILGDEIVIVNDDKLVCYGKTLGVLNEEKTLKRLGLGLPFIIELNKYLMDYELIDNYYLSNKKLIGALWK